VSVLHGLSMHPTHLRCVKVVHLAVRMEHWNDPAVLLPRAFGWPTPFRQSSPRVRQGIPAIMSVNVLLFPEKRVNRITINEASRSQFLHIT
jgi:hypothetical protein